MRPHPLRRLSVAITIILFAGAATAQGAIAILAGSTTPGGWFAQGGLPTGAYFKVGLTSPGYPQYDLIAESGFGTRLFVSDDAHFGMNVGYGPEFPGQGPRGISWTSGGRAPDGRLSASIYIEHLLVNTSDGSSDAFANVTGKYTNATNQKQYLEMDVHLHGQHWSLPAPGTPNWSTLLSQITVYGSNQAFESQKRGYGRPLEGDEFEGFLGPGGLVPLAHEELVITPGTMGSPNIQTVPRTIGFEVEPNQVFYVVLRMTGILRGGWGEVDADNTFEMAFTAESEQHLLMMDPGTILPEPNTVALLTIGTFALLRRRAA